MSNLFEIARQIVLTAHDGQIDKAGQPYVDHPIAVANMVSGEIAPVAVNSNLYTNDDDLVPLLQQLAGDVISSINTRLASKGQ